MNVRVQRKMITTHAAGASRTDVEFCIPPAILVSTPAPVVRLSDVMEGYHRMTMFNIDWRWRTNDTMSREHVYSRQLVTTNRH